jgi:hypothetical protein
MRQTSILSLIFGCALGTFAAALAAQDIKVDEQLVGPGGSGSSYVISQRGLHVASVSLKGSRTVVTVDGVAGPQLDQVLTPAGQPYGGSNVIGVSEVGDVGQPVIFSPDGAHFAYAGRIGSDAVIFYDGKEIARGPYNASVLNFGPLCFSDNGKHLFFILADTSGGQVKRQFMMDGQPLPILPQQSPPAVLFSPDDSRYLYYGVDADNKPLMVIDGKDAGYVGNDPRFTADNKVITMAVDGSQTLLIDGKLSQQGNGVIKVFLPKTGSKIITVNTRPNPGGAMYFLVVDGQKVDASECINNIDKVVFSPDGKRYMARCTGQGARWMIIDGKKELEYPGIGDDFGFSADSSKYAYLAGGTKNFMIIDGTESDGFDMVGAKPLFAPAGSRVAYIGGVNRLQMQVVVDGKPDPMQRDVVDLSFSPDGSRYAYRFGGLAGPAAIALDGKEIAGFLSSWFIFSPDSNHIVFPAQRQSDMQNGLFVDGQLVYKQVGRFTKKAFSPDSKHFYFATVETGQPVAMVVYADGKKVASYDANANAAMEAMGESFEVADDGTLSYLVLAPEGMKKIKLTPPADSNVEAMVANFKASEEKSLADAQAARDAQMEAAAKAKADAEAARAKAIAEAQQAREAAQAARLKAQQDAQAARLKAQQEAAAARQKALQDAAAARAARQNRRGN